MKKLSNPPPDTHSAISRSGARDSEAEGARVQRRAAAFHHEYNFRQSAKELEVTVPLWWLQPQRLRHRTECPQAGTAHPPRRAIHMYLKYY